MRLKEVVVHEGSGTHRGDRGVAVDRDQRVTYRNTIRGDRFSIAVPKVGSSLHGMWRVGLDLDPDAEDPIYFKLLICVQDIRALPRSSDKTSTPLDFQRAHAHCALHSKIERLKREMPLVKSRTSDKNGYRAPGPVSGRFSETCKSLSWEFLPRSMCPGAESASNPLYGGCVTN